MARAWPPYQRAKVELWDPWSLRSLRTYHFISHRLKCLLHLGKRRVKQRGTIERDNLPPDPQVVALLSDRPWGGARDKDACPRLFGFCCVASTAKLESKPFARLFVKRDDGGQRRGGRPPRRAALRSLASRV